MQTFLTHGSYKEYEITDGETFGKFVTMPDELYIRYKKTFEEWKQIQKELAVVYAGVSK